MLAEALRQARLQSQKALAGLQAEDRAVGCELARLSAELRKLAADGSSKADRLADVQERIGRAEGRRRQIQEQIAALACQKVEEAEIRAALSSFDPGSEVLNNPGEPVVLFVADPLEKAAEKEYGKPLPGRRFSVERSREEQPDAVVARILPEGSRPMGPAVYLDAEGRAINTLLCQCMPRQASHVKDDPRYEVLPLDILGEVQIAPDGPFRVVHGAAPLVSTGEHPWLERVLRMPKP